MPTTINDELTRIEDAKSGIATAIGSKGVTVPVNATIDDYANLIGAIQTDGGIPNLQSKSVNITTNGTTNVVADSGYDGLSSVEVGVNVESYYNFIKGVLEDTLTDVVIPDGVTSIRGYSLRGLIHMKTLTIPDTVESLGIYCVYQDTNLETFNGGSGLTILNYSCFYGCTKLVNVNLKSVNKLAEYCFYNCSALTSLILPDNVTFIQSHSLQNSNITTLVIKATEPPTLTGSSWIQDTPIYNNAGYIYVPNSVVNDYKSANYWNSLESRIKGYDIDSQGRIVDAEDHTHILVNADGTFYVEP